MTLPARVLVKWSALKADAVSPVKTARRRAVRTTPWSAGQVADALSRIRGGAVANDSGDSFDGAELIGDVFAENDAEMLLYSGKQIEHGERVDAQYG